MNPHHQLKISDERLAHWGLDRPGRKSKFGPLPSVQTAKRSSVAINAGFTNNIGQLGWVSGIQSQKSTTVLVVCSGAGRREPSKLDHEIRVLRFRPKSKENVQTHPFALISSL
jgi:hypothetical protein